MWEATEGKNEADSQPEATVAVPVRGKGSHGGSVQAKVSALQSRECLLRHHRDES